MLDSLQSLWKAIGAGGGGQFCNGTVVVRSVVDSPSVVKIPLKGTTLCRLDK